MSGVFSVVTMFGVKIKVLQCLGQSLTMYHQYKALIMSPLRHSDQDQLRFEIERVMECLFHPLLTFQFFQIISQQASHLGRLVLRQLGGHLVEKSLALASQVRLQELQVPTEPSSQAPGG